VLGEGDLIYTKTLCRIGHEDYTNKTVLILGGGDGGILHELRKQNVGFITMAEIGILLADKYLNILIHGMYFLSFSHAGRHANCQVPQVFWFRHFS